MFLTLPLANTSYQLGWHRVLETQTSHQAFRWYRMIHHFAQHVSTIPGSKVYSISVSVCIGRTNVWLVSGCSAMKTHSSHLMMIKHITFWNTHVSVATYARRSLNQSFQYLTISVYRCSCNVVGLHHQIGKELLIFLLLTCSMCDSLWPFHVKYHNFLLHLHCFFLLIIIWATR